MVSPAGGLVMVGAGNKGKAVVGRGKTRNKDKRAGRRPGRKEGSGQSGH